ncbi:hypothetical protein [Halomarina oriensis]|uniref:Uncharacterized protein n=1 Tax=Halomarina oriensis TaxID=671145 RepID=A0A6B0GG99_9EURY|nr:hypothetical protein [Halomarina oriensis]MWG33966.1 hypothetical protein [Halomarina oriensis]
MSDAAKTGRLRDALRTGEYSDVLVVFTFLVGLAVTAVHWVGLVVGGLLLGVLAPSFWRAVQYGLYFGIAVLAAFLAYLWLFGALGQFAVAGQLTWLALGATLVLPTLAAMVRGLG